MRRYRRAHAQNVLVTQRRLQPRKKNAMAILIMNGLDRPFAGEIRATVKRHLNDYLVFAENEAPASQFDRLVHLTPLPKNKMVTLAMTGRGFHGQNARAWLTYRHNLFLCAKFETTRPVPMDYLDAMQWIAPLAVVETLRLFSDTEPHIKPINDVMLDNQKIAGCLTHYRPIQDRHCAIFGIGLNLFHAPTCDQPTTCLLDHLNSFAATHTRVKLYGQVFFRLTQCLKLEFDKFIAEPETTEQRYETWLS